MPEMALMTATMIPKNNTSVKPQNAHLVVGVFGFTGIDMMFSGTVKPPLSLKVERQGQFPFINTKFLRFGMYRCRFGDAEQF